MKKIVVANWKMNGSKQLCRDYVEMINNSELSHINLIVCPPFVYCDYLFNEIVSHKNVFIGSQDCSQYDEGAYTGDISCKILSEFGVKYSIIGHSERIKYHSESYDLISKKVAASIRNNITPILCVGSSNSLENELKFFKNNLKNYFEDIIIAYEPAAVIGGDKLPEISDIEKKINLIKKFDSKTILYGGAVKPNNIHELNTLPINGVLVGGASLKIDQMMELLK